MTAGPFVVGAARPAGSADERWFLVFVGLLAAAWWFLAERFAVYDAARKGSIRAELLAVLEAVTASFAAAGCAVWLAGLPLPAAPLRALIGVLGLLAASRLLQRFFSPFARLSGRAVRHALLIGEGEAADEIASAVNRDPRAGVRLVGRLTFRGLTGARSGLSSVRHLGRAADLPRAAGRYVVDLVFLCPPPDATCAEVSQVLEACREGGVRCLYVQPSSKRGRAPAPAGIEAVQPACSPDEDVAPERSFWKRALDVVAATLLLIGLSPIFLMIAAAIWFEDGFPVLFAQPRAGKNGRIFPCLKFRSMYRDAEKRLAELVAANEQDGPVFKMRSDPRVTRVGRFLRKYSLDELPQLWNVLLGQMSLVGPRPPIPEEVVKYDWWQRRRLSVTPGMTCIWQVWGRNRVSFDRWVEMDLEYIDNWSLWTDLKLIARTFQVVFKGTGM